jgi:phosphate transport system substrate-binding protein
MNLSVCKLLTIILVLFLALSACGGTPPPPVRLVLAGSPAMQPLVQELGAAYHQQHREVTIEVQATDSLAGAKAVREGTADIGLASRSLTEDEAAGLTTTLIAHEPLAIVVNAANPLDVVSSEELRHLFSGRVNDWSEFGGDSSEVVVLSREDGAETRGIFESLVMAGTRVSPNAQVLSSDAAVVEVAGATPGAIGYAARESLTPQVKVLSIDGVAPTPLAVQRGEYRLARPFYFLTHGQPSGAAKGFVDFVLSAEGQRIVQRLRYARVK